jgi:hypothetical protein
MTTCLIFARALKDKGTPMPDIARKLVVIKTGKNTHRMDGHCGRNTR